MPSPCLRTLLLSHGCRHPRGRLGTFLLPLLHACLLAAAEPPCPLQPDPVLPVTITVTEDGLRITADGTPRIAAAQTCLVSRTDSDGPWIEERVPYRVTAMDEDHLVLEADVRRALTGFAAFLTSDWADQWDAQAMAVVRRWWNANGPRVPAAIHLALTDDGLPATVTAAYDADHFAVGVYNWQETARDATIDLDAARIPRGRPCTTRSDDDEGVPVLDGRRLTIHGLPPDGMRIVHLTCAPR